MKWNALHNYIHRRGIILNDPVVQCSIIAIVPSTLEPSKNIHLTLPWNFFHHFIYLHNMTALSIVVRAAAVSWDDS